MNIRIRCVKQGDRLAMGELRLIRKRTSRLNLHVECNNLTMTYVMKGHSQESDRRTDSNESKHTQTPRQTNSGKSEDKKMNVPMAMTIGQERQNDIRWEECEENKPCKYLLVDSFVLNKRGEKIQGKLVKYPTNLCFEVRKFSPDGYPKGGLRMVVGKLPEFLKLIESLREAEAYVKTNSTEQ